MENEKLNILLKLQKNFDLNLNQEDNLKKCYEIIQILITLPNEKQYDILSSILLQKNQSLYIIFGIYQHLIQNKYILNSNNEILIKYYQLLLHCLKKNKEKSLLSTKEIEYLISILEKKN